MTPGTKRIPAQIILKTGDPYSRFIHQAKHFGFILRSCRYLCFKHATSLSMSPICKIGELAHFQFGKLHLLHLERRSLGYLLEFTQEFVA